MLRKSVLLLCTVAAAAGELRPKGPIVASASSCGRAMDSEWYAGVSRTLPDEAVANLQSLVLFVGCKLLCSMSSSLDAWHSQMSAETCIDALFHTEARPAIRPLPGGLAA